MPCWRGRSWARPRSAAASPCRIPSSAGCRSRSPSWPGWSGPIDYDARDGEPVDLVFLVLWPEAATEGFLPALSGICRALRDNQLPRQLRQAGSAAEALAKLRAADDRSPDALP